LPKCEICGKELKDPTSARHINSKFHQDALNKLKEEQGILVKGKKEEINIDTEKTNLTELTLPDKKQKYVNKITASISIRKRAHEKRTKDFLKFSKKIKVKTHSALTTQKFANIYSTALSLLIIIISIASGMTIIFETVDYIQKDYRDVLIIIEIIAAIILSVEFLLRLWTCDLNPKYDGMPYKRLRYMSNFLPLVDLSSIIAIILGLIIPLTSEYRGFVRIFHLIVFFKLVRYSQSFDIIWTVIKEKKEELLITFILSLLLMFLGSILMFLTEHDAQPEVFTNLFSSMWFTAINLFTIGYGEITPITTMGKIVSSVISVIGITVFLLPASVIGSGFVDEIQARNPLLEKCPNCQHVIERSELLREVFARSRGRKPKYLKKVLEEVKKQDVYYTHDAQFSRQRFIYENLEFRYPHTILQVVIFVFFATFITFNILIIMAETNPILYQENRTVIFTVLMLSAIVFTVEFLLRVWSIVAAEEEKFHDKIQGRLNYIKSFMGITDLIFLISLYLTIFLFNAFPSGIPVLLALRMFVIFQIGHFLAVFDIIGVIIKYSKKEFFTTILLCVIFLICASTIIYHLEKDAQPEKFRSIPSTIWFGVTTFTTTGFGDVYPITTAGRLATISFAFLGVSLFTLPAGILGASFFTSMKEFRMYLICPKCGFLISKPKLSKKRISI